METGFSTRPNQSIG